MTQSSLDTLAMRLAAHLDCTQDVACRQIMQAMVETGLPLAHVDLARRL
jgi:alkylmercury lyase